ncbi:MAG: His/Gly/Thr/Pro-type tRNA ligase C-terminal domain-containing protein [Clostridia bacterium]|nr:His/Gly/Thr/Pro-type tRNA ligase C-terminal domain-containing protein [Clostridia bacterium]
MTAKKFRDAGIATDVYYLDKGMKPKMKYANRIGVKYAAIIGESEVANGTVTLKDMVGGEQISATVDEAINKIKA